MSRDWRWGERPPKWVMKEFERALFLMGKNKEAIHAFDMGVDWSFVIAVCTRDCADRTMKAMATAIAGQIIDSAHFYGGQPPRLAVHGDLYP